MTSTYRVRLDDDNGRFWMQERERMWSEDMDDALTFTSWSDASIAACAAKGRVLQSEDWFPKIKVVAFK